VVGEACKLLSGEERLTLAQVAARLHVGPFQLQRRFKAALGITPRDFAAARRTGRLKALLAEREPVASALYEAGYGSSSRLYERAPAQLGMTPEAYRKGGHGVEIHYTVESSPLGKLLVAGTDKGICFVSLGENEHGLVETLRGEFPAARLERDGARLARWVHQITAYLEGRGTTLDLPLDVQATAFQWRVWHALQTIPSTYAQIARALGNPKAMRAVGHACATNPVALVVPCHRAVRSDGGLGGYRWGPERKERLLAMERSK
jgi:AraC family transcriptional regulator of adaptative response/methylated-DNA-[protein]-cysteine methyltransferase